MKASAFAIITDAYDHVLLCHRRDRDLWNLPGGGVEENESPWAAVVREVAEETLLHVDVIRVAGIYYKKNHDEVSFLFACSVKGGKAGLTSEADKVEYFDINALPENTSLRQKERILDAFKHKLVLVIRDQDDPFVNSHLRESSSTAIYTKL